MKKNVFALIALLALCMIPALSQTFTDETLENTNEQLIIHSESFSLVDYTLEDGTKLIQKDLTSLLLTVPGNEELLKKSKGWRITGYSFLGVAAASLGTNLAYTLADDLPGKNIVVPTTVYAFVGSSLLSLFAFELGAWNQMKAVDKYNVKVRLMGLPLN